MRLILLISAIVFVASCVNEAQHSQMAKDKPEVMINMDKFAIKCIDDPKSLGFADSQECFSHAQKMFNSNK